MELFNYFSKDKPKEEQDAAVKAFDSTPGPLSELAVPSKKKEQLKKRHNPPVFDDSQLAAKKKDSKIKDQETQYFLQNLASKYTKFEQKYLEDDICGVVSNQTIDEFLNNELERQNLELKLTDQPTKEWTPKEKEIMREYLKHVTPLLRIQTARSYEIPWNEIGKGSSGGLLTALLSSLLFHYYSGGGEKNLTTDQIAAICGAGSLAGIFTFLCALSYTSQNFNKKIAKATQKYVKKLGEQ
ncbi:hypothetical protein HY837_01675 [archaeon]|nr:hypothetical protein [archaeon]